MSDTSKTAIASGAEQESGSWFLYLIRCDNGKLYTGITTDVARRFQEHSNGLRGARFLRGRGPLTLVFHASVGSRGDALRAEYRIKQLRKAQKEALIDGRIELAALMTC